MRLAGTASRLISLVGHRGSRCPGRGRPLDDQVAATVLGRDAEALAIVVGRGAHRLKLLAVPLLSAAMDVAIGRDAKGPDVDLAIDRHDLQRTLVLELYGVLADHVAAPIDRVADLRRIGKVGCKRSPARRQEDGRRGQQAQHSG